MLILAADNGVELHAGGTRFRASWGPPAHCRTGAVWADGRFG